MGHSYGEGNFIQWKFKLKFLIYFYSVRQEILELKDFG